MERLSTSNVSVGNGNTKKINFCSKFAIKTLPCYGCTDTGCLQFLHTLFDTYWTTYWRNLNQTVWFEMDKISTFLTKKKCFFNHFWQNGDAIFQDVSVAETTFVLFLFCLVNCSFSDYYLSAFQGSKKLW